MPRSSRAKVLWFARLEYRFHAWRERRARARGLRPAVTGFPGYGSEEWVRVLGRVLIAPPLKRTASGQVQAVLRHGRQPLEVSRRCVANLRQELRDL